MLSESIRGRFCDDGRNMYSGKPGICSEKYCRNLPEKGDIDSAIQTLEGAFSDTESEDICIELIGILKEHQKLQKARQYAIQLKQRMDPAPENAYDTGYMLAACYFLYSIEENKTEKTQLWKECLKYYKMLGTNEIEEHCGDFLVEYIQKETSSMEEVLSVIDRVREYGKIISEKQFSGMS